MPSEQAAARPTVHAVEVAGLRIETPLEVEIDGGYRRGGVVVAIDIAKRDVAWAQAVYPPSPEDAADVFICGLEVLDDGATLGITADDGSAYLMDLATCRVRRVG